MPQDRRPRRQPRLHPRQPRGRAGEKPETTPADTTYHRTIARNHEHGPRAASVFQDDLASGARRQARWSLPKASAWRCGPHRVPFCKGRGARSRGAQRAREVRAILRRLVMFLPASGRPIASSAARTVMAPCVRRKSTGSPHSCPRGRERLACRRLAPARHGVARGRQTSRPPRTSRDGGCNRARVCGSDTHDLG